MMALSREHFDSRVAPETSRILVVDDRSANRLVMVEALRELGYPIVTAASGTEALRILMHQEFAVVLLDVNMPGIDGFEVSRLIRARDRTAKTPIIFVTAISTGDQSVAAGYSLGAVDYVFIPVVPEILRAKVSVFVDLDRKTRLLEAAARRLEALVREKETLLREVHHRVKNNLQVISSMINMQARQLRETPPREALYECRNRIRTIALIHEKLYEAQDYAHVPFSDYVRSLADQVFSAADMSREKVTLELEIEPLALEVDRAIPCGLIVNELVTNALKHAFPGDRGGTVRVALHGAAGKAVLRVTDDGIGIPHDFDPAKATTLGLELVTTLVEQLGGSLEIIRGVGVAFQVAFRVDGK